MKIITSRENPHVKQLKLLSSNVPMRKRGGKALAEGVHLCEAYLQGNTPEICVVSEAAEGNKEVAAILDICEARDVACLQLPSALFDEVSQVERGVGILFVIAVPRLDVPQVLQHDAVLLDQVQDPGNMGSILRSAAAAGIKQIYCSSGCVQCWTPKVLRSGMGAHFLLDIFDSVDLQGLISKAQVPILATSSHATQVVYDRELTQPVAWMFGNEGQGVSPHLLEMIENTVALPHIGAMESLNVAACAAICLFEQVRQRRAW